MISEKIKLNYKCYAVIFLVMIFLGTIYVCADTEDISKNILILNAYHKGLSWTDQETDGIINTIKKSDVKSFISVEYMDWKNYPTKENMDWLYHSLKYKYANKKIDIVITSDDAALEFALKNRANLFSNAPIVFCGVNNDGVKKICQGYFNYTGITEIVEPENTIKAALTINPSIKEIFLIYDNTESGLSTGALTVQAVKKVKPEIKVTILNQKSISEIINVVGQAPSDSIVLITTYYTDKEGNVAGFEDFTELVSRNSRVPVFHLYDFGIGHGAIGGSMLSGRLQGENAGKLAVRVLQGENILQIPVVQSKTTHYIFDYQELKRFNIPLRAIPEGSEIINNPFSLFDIYPGLISAVSIIFILLILFICVLAFYLSKISRMKYELNKNHEELTQLYHELTDSDNRLKQQYNELTAVQHSLVSSEKKYALLFEKMLNGFFVFEPVMNKMDKLIDLRFINVNPGFENQVNLNVKGIIGKTWMEVFGYPNQDLSRYNTILQTGGAEHFETYYANSAIYYLVNAFKISENQVGVVFDNITEYKQAIKEITVLNAALEQRVAERTSELQNAVNDLEAFTYTVSHDLKSPLRAVDVYSRILSEDFGPKLGDEAQRVIQSIKDICKDMIEMVDKLLQFSTVTKSVLQKEEINIEEKIQAIFRELKTVYPERDIKLIIETRLPKIYADRILLSQVIKNILSNAIKFTRDKDKTIIRVGCTITEAEYVFYIKDNGVGFNMEYAEKLFGIFQRLHTSDEFEGNGIGLVTIKKIIQKHNGRTWIEGQVGVGTTIYIALPITWNEIGP